VSAPGMANVGYNKGLLRRPLFSWGNEMPGQEDIEKLGY
jgi:hypothetical protein